MPMDSVAQENVDAILKEKADTENELIALKNTTPEQMWMVELDAFDIAYSKYKTERMKIQRADGAKSSSSSSKKPKEAKVAKPTKK